MSLNAAFNKTAGNPDQPVNDNGETLLHVAAKAGDAPQVKAAIEAQATVHVLDKQNNTPLVYATENGDIQLMRLLLKADASHIDHAGSLGTALCVAAARGNLEAAATLLEAGADVNARGTDGVTPLMTAVFNQREEMALFLLKKRADVTLSCDKRENALHRAAFRDDAAMLDTLFAYGAARVLQQASKDKLLTPLHVAIAEGAKNAARCLLDHGAFTHLANEKGLTPLSLAAEKGDAALSRLLVECGAADLNKISAPSEYTPFQHAVFEKNLAAAKMLLRLGADPHQKDGSNRTPLQLAAWKGDLAMVRFLTEEVPAEPDAAAARQSQANALYEAAFYGHGDVVAYLAAAPDAPLNLPNSFGNYPVTASIDRDSTALLEALLNNGAAPDVNDRDGASPLLTAARKGRMAATEALLLADANPNLGDGLETPLHAAIEGDHTAIVRLLVEFGADIRARDNLNREPIDLARGKGRSAAVAILEAARADYDSLQNRTFFQGFKPQ